MMYGGIEAGGTRFRCVVGLHPNRVMAEAEFPTTTPEEMLPQVVDFFQEQYNNFPITALGVGTFGPVDLRKTSPTYGHIMTTPKPGWANTDIVGFLTSGLNVPVVIDTDVNAAALGEHCWGAAQDVDHFIYLTIGTGIGGGGMIDGQLLHSSVHPEMGHIRIPHDKDKDPYEGVCPFHGDCLEGLASGSALEQRWGQPAEWLPTDHLAWKLEAHYLASALVNFICTLSPQRIILGGGVMQQEQLFPSIRQNVLALLNHYLQHDAFLSDIDRYILPPALGRDSGIWGAIALAQQATTD